ncbi:hypothetical protein JCM11491_004675 [Sporobolomyces phaffii]
MNSEEKDLPESLARVLKHYAARSPSVAALVPAPRPFPSAREWSRASTQQWAVEHLVRRSPSPSSSSDATSAWEKGFWKRVVQAIEQGFDQRRDQDGESLEDEEVEEEILERMVHHLSAGPGQASISERTYYWGALRDVEQRDTEWKCVRTREEARMISGGTTGLRTWQACIALSNHFLVDPGDVVHSATNVVELGAGVGLLSLVVAKLKEEGDGSRRPGTVFATDVDDKVLELLDANVRLNGLEARVRTSRLDWELAGDLDAHGDELSTWERETFGDDERGRPDLIIGADIVYDPTLTAQLAATIAWLLRPRVDARPLLPPIRAIIAGTIRNESTWQLFLTECRSRRLRVEDVELRTFRDGSGIVGAEGWEGEGTVRVVRLTRAE